MNETTRDAEDELASLADPVSQNISDILERWFEAVSRCFARPAYPVPLLSFVVGWVTLNLRARSLGLPRFDPPPFTWLDGILTLRHC